MIVGGKNSAAEAALDLYRSGVHVTLVHRRAELGASIKYWVKPDIENRIKEGSIQAHFETRVVEIRPSEVVVEPVGASAGARRALPADAVFLLTGYLADLDFLRQCGVAVDAATNVPRHDPETFETNVPGLYLAGSVVAGANRGGSVHRERALPRTGGGPRRHPQAVRPPRRNQSAVRLK